MKKITVHDKKFKKHISHKKIVDRVNEMAKSMEIELADLNPIFLPVLNGSFMFASDLLKRINIPCQVSFIKVASYSGTESTGNLKDVIGLTESLKGRHVVIVEDIIDTGFTMNEILKRVQSQNPASIKIVTFLFKKICLKIPVNPDYFGFEIPDLFVVGYGLDYDGYGRNLPHLFALDQK